MADPEAPEVVTEKVEETDAANDSAAQGDVAPSEEESKASVIAGQLMQNPQVLAALQGRLEGMIGTRSGYIESLPKAVKRRLKALKKLQFENIKIESEFYKEVHDLECTYQAKYRALLDKRQEIVNGGIEPTDSDCDWPSDEEDEEEKKLSKKAQVEGDENGAKDGEKTEEKKEVKDEEEEPVSGVPEFWLTIFKNVDLLSDMVQEHDEPILKHLEDIQLELQRSDPMGFTLKFVFGENEHFTNRILTKQYFMNANPDEEDPFAYEGPEIVKCTGCKIDWKPSKNVTVKLVKKTQKHKGRGTKRTVTKTVQNDSFFNFFSPPSVPEEGEMDDDTETMLSTDFEIGHYIRERIVNRAVLYFTGEALEDEEDFEDDEGEEEEEDDDDAEYDEDEDPDYSPEKGKKGKGEEKPECKQQ